MTCLSWNVENGMIHKYNITSQLIEDKKILMKSISFKEHANLGLATGPQSDLSYSVLTLSRSAIVSKDSQIS